MFNNTSPNAIILYNALRVVDPGTADIYLHSLPAHLRGIKSISKYLIKLINSQGTYVGNITRRLSEITDKSEWVDYVYSTVAPFIVREGILPPHRRVPYENLSYA